MTWNIRHAWYTLKIFISLGKSVIIIFYCLYAYSEDLYPDIHYCRCNIVHFHDLRVTYIFNPNIPHVCTLQPTKACFMPNSIRSQMTSCFQTNNSVISTTKKTSTKNAKQNYNLLGKKKQYFIFSMLHVSALTGHQQALYKNRKICKISSLYFLCSDSEFKTVHSVSTLNSSRAVRAADGDPRSNERPCTVHIHNAA